MDKYENVKTWLLGLLKKFPTVCPGGDCDTCPYYEYEDCSERMRNDALILLKEQEVKPHRCKECSYRRKDDWCDECRRIVKESDYCSFGSWEG